MQSFSFLIVATEINGNSSSHRALSVENDFCMSCYLQLQCRDNTKDAKGLFTPDFIFEGVCMERVWNLIALL